MIGAADFRRRQAEARRAGRYLGLGLGCYVEGTGIGPYEGAHVRVEPSGKVLVATGLTTQGQGHGTTFAQIAADAIGCSPADVSVVTGDTTKFNWGAGTYASRGLVTSGNAIHRAATAVRDKALRLAASLLEVSPHDLELADGRARVKGVPGKELTLGALATVANPIRYAYGKGAAEAALRLVKPRAGRRARRGRGAGARGARLLRAPARDLCQRLPCRDRRGGRRHRQRDDPALRRPARLRHPGEPDDRRGADPRRRRAGGRWLVLRADRLRRQRPAARHDFHGLPDADGHGSSRRSRSATSRRPRR